MSIISLKLSKRLTRTGVGLGLAMAVVLTGVMGQAQALAATEAEPKWTPAEALSQGDTQLMTQEAIQPPIEGYRITQKYNWHHTGLDMAAKVGTPVKPLRRGIVTQVEKKRWGYGNNVVVQHGPEYQTLYAHLSKIGVQEGQVVDMNTVLGEVGSTGMSTGPHLHVEVRLNDKAIDPNLWLDLPQLAKKVGLITKTW